MQSTRSKLVTRRTYCRPTTDGQYEDWTEVCTRVTAHQRWLWERALDRELSLDEEDELNELRVHMLSRTALPSGRILWMGGTEQAKKTEIAMFNCSFLETRDVYSAVDAFYLLLNGCGVGFKPVRGLLNGFSAKAEVKVLRSPNDTDSGNPDNNEILGTAPDGKRIWCLQVGDSGVAWAKAFGKLLAMKHRVDMIILDFAAIRRPGVQLAGYGWLSSGDEAIVKAFVQVCEILNERADQLLTEIDILDIINLVGTTLTSRRSAEIAMLDESNQRAEEFMYVKQDHYEKAPWRSQSNNSLVFYSRPSKLKLRGIFSAMLEAGGSEPGFYNGEAALRRAPWFAGTNPCGEILLADGGLCNLVEFNVSAFDWSTLEGRRAAYRAIRLLARANYRQTCVRLKDGVLSDKWHETQDFLRLCGVGLTGIVEWMDKYHDLDYAAILQELRQHAVEAVDEMADELGLPRAKAVTTIKPSGTLGKLMDTSEGLHRPIGRYIHNWIKFNINDPTVEKLRGANYKVLPDPYEPTNSVIACIPVDNGAGKWEISGGKEINNETALVQLERYKLVMENYVDHNASVSITYSPEEVPAIVEWLYSNWDTYVGVSFILRQDNSKSAKDLGFPYLPQEVVSAMEYNIYTSSLLDVDFEGGEMLDIEECEGGACPVR